MKSDTKLPELWARSVTQDRAAEADPSTAIEVNVIFTDGEGTRTALKAAGALAHNLRARINLLALQVVPFAFPLTQPPVSIPFTEHRLLELAGQGAQGPLDTTVHLCLCRDERQVLLQVLRPKSLVVIGGRKRWWRTRAQRLAEMLRRDGHEVISAYL